MRNSLLTINPCKFKGGCTKPPAFGCGAFCDEHKEFDPGYKRKQQKKRKKAVSRRIAPAGSTPALTEALKLRQWFFEGIAQLDRHPVCMECGEPIIPAHYQAACHHILPKRKRFGFPSVAANPHNRLFLGAVCGCHNIFHISWARASKMKIWPLALQKLQKVYPFIAPSELKNLPDILRHDYEQQTKGILITH